MSDNREEFVIDFTADISDVQKDVSKLVEVAAALPENLKDTQTNIGTIANLLQQSLGADGNNPFSNIPRQLEFALKQAVDSAKPQIAKIGDMLRKDLSGDSAVSGLNQQIGFLAANLENVLNSAKTVSKLTANMEASMFNEFNEDLKGIQREIVKATHSAAIKSKMGAASDKQIVDLFMSKRGNAAGMAAMSQRYSLNDAAQRELLNAILQVSSPSYMRRGYFDSARRYSGKSMPRVDYINEYTSYRDRLPDRFKDLPIDPNQLASVSQEMQDIYSQYISNQERKIVLDLAKRNETFRQSLIKAGAGAYKTTASKGAGSFYVPKKMTRLQLAQAEGFLFYDQMKPAWEGNPVNYKALSDRSADAQRKLANKGNSTVVEGLSALHVLKDINANVPVIYNPNATISPYRGTNGRYVGHVQSVKNDQYMVMSLTPDDFKRGAVPPSDKVIEANERRKLDKLEGKSSYIMLNNSLYTQLAGMRGHNTPGTGKTGSVINNPNMFNNAPMIVVDYSALIHEKDASGNLVWDKNGQPKPNESVLKEIENLFTPNANATIRYGGGKEYHYPVVTRTVNGENHRYVPTNIKGGGVYMINEDAYVKHSKASLEKFGRNIFDNFTDLDAEYEYQKDANKLIEARNRLLTPSTPFEKLGGVTPNFNRVGFVDMEDVFGHDGSMFFMPGFIPGNDAVVRAPGIKGVGQTVDYKKLIKDLYGLDDNASFYLPGLNTPKELKELYRSGGISAIINNEKYGPNALRDYFVDVMQTDALIPESVIKTSMFDGLHSKEAAALMQDVQGLFGGFRVVDTAMGFASDKQRSLSSQISQNLVLTDEQIKANVQAWDDYIYSLQNDVEFQKKHVFNRPDDPIDVAFRENPSIITTNRLAQTRLAQTIESAKNEQNSGRIFADDLLSMRLALANPGEWIMRAGIANAGKIVDKQLADALKLGDNIIGAAGYGTHTGIDVKAGGGRYPNTIGEQFPLTISGVYRDRVIDRYNLNRHAAYLNAKTIKEMGGGDFDGDTVQLAIGWLANAFETTKSVRGSQLAPYATTKADPENLKMPDDARKIAGQHFARMLYRQATAPIFMGGVSNAIDALSQGNWDDEIWLKTTGASATQLRAMYDIDSTFAKTGILADWTKEANNARYMGKPFVKVFKDLESALQTGDFSKMQRFSDINYPSIYSNATAIAMSSLNRNPIANSSVESLIKAQRELEGINEHLIGGTPSTSDQARAQFLDLSIQSFAEMLTRGSALSNDTYEDLTSRLTIWSSIIDDELTDPGISAERQKVLQEQQSEIDKQRRKMNHARLFGLYEQNILDGKGYAASGLFKEFSYTGRGGTFQTTTDEVNYEADLERLAIAAQVATNPAIVAATKGLIDHNKIASAQRQADEFTYSYSMMHQFAEKPVEWYRQRILKEKPADNIHFALGDAVHSAAEEWANARRDNQNNSALPTLSSDELESIFTQQLLSRGKEFFSVDENGKIIPSDSTIADKLKVAFEFVRNLPGMFLDEDIISIERELPLTLPNLGNKILTPDEAVNTVGYIDLRTRQRLPGEKPGQASGPYINTDWKPSTRGLNNDQFNLYAGAVPTDKIRVVGYGDNTSIIRDVNPSDVEAATHKYAGIVSNIQHLATTTGFDWATMNQIPGWNKLSPNISVEDILAQRREQQRAESEYRESLLHRGKTSISLEEELAYKENAAAIQKQTGQGIAKGISLQQDITDYTNELLKMQSQLRSKEFRSQNDGVRNPWAGYEYALVDSYQKRREELELRGATSADLVSLAKAQRDAQDQFKSTLRTSAVHDISDLNKSLSEEMMAADGKTAVSQYSKQFEELTSRITEARLAYEQLKNSEDKTDDDIAAIKSAEDELSALDKTVAARKEQLRQKSTEAFDADAVTMQDIAAYGKVSGLHKIDEQARQLHLKIDNNILQADTDLKSGLIDQTERDRRVAAMQAVDVGKYKTRLIEEFLSNNQQRYASQIDSLSHALSPNNVFSSLQYQSQDYKNRIESLRTSLAKDFKLGEISESDYNSNIRKLEELESAASVAQLGFKKLGDTASHALTQFGRQMFHKAINEVRQFITAYDAAMTEIQMVTLKTDEDISTLGEGLIDVAVELKAPLSTITDSATALYRQGLDESEVNARLSDVVKFATTANVKAQDAIKLITVATNSEIEISAQRAMDVVSALSDSAATEAAQITKGLQKSLPAANASGVSYEELVSMLTVITSKTQLSGSVAGTTMRNILSRISRFDSDDIYYDEKGHQFSGSKQALTLRAVGVETADAEGNLRSVYDILTDIGKVWTSLNDAQKQSVIYTIGSTEQYSNVATLIEAFSETDELGNNLMDKYLQITENANGITNEKYTHQAESLAASLTNVKNSFDSLIESIKGTEFITDGLDYISNAINGIEKINEALGGWPITLTLITAAVVALTAACNANPLIKTASVVIAGLSVVGNAISYAASNWPTAEKKLAESDKRYANRESMINEARQINEKRENGEMITESELSRIQELLVQLSLLCGDSVDLGKDFKSLSSSAEKTAAALDGLEKSSREVSARERQESIASSILRMDSAISDYNEPMNTSQGLDEAKAYLLYKQIASTISADDATTYNNLSPGDRAVFDYYNGKEQAGEEEVYALISQIFSNEKWAEIFPDDTEVSLVERYNRGDQDVIGKLWAITNDSTARSVFNTDDQSRSALIRDEMYSVFNTVSGFSETGLIEPLIEKWILPDVDRDIPPSVIIKLLSDEFGFLTTDSIIKTIEKTPGIRMSVGDSFDRYLESISKLEDDTKGILTTEEKAEAFASNANTAWGATGTSSFGNSILSLYNLAKETQALSQNNDPIGQLTYFLDGLDGISNYAAILNEYGDDVAKSAREMIVKNPETGAAEGIDQTALNDFIIALSSKDDRIFEQQSKTDTAKLAAESMEYLESTRFAPDAYQTLGTTEEDTLRRQGALREILGEDLYQIIIKGDSSEDAIDRANMLIANYGVLGSKAEDEMYRSDVALRSLLGDNYRDGLSDEEWSYAKLRYDEMMTSPEGMQRLNDILELEGGIDLLKELAQAFDETSVKGENCGDALGEIVKNMDADELAKLNKYKKNLSELQKVQAGIAAGGKDAVDVVFGLTEKAKDFNNITWAVNQFEAGNRSNKVTETIASYFGDVESKDLKKTFGDRAKSYVDLYRAALNDAASQLAGEADQATNDLFAKANQEMLASTGQDIISIGNIKIGGTVDISALSNAMSGATGEWGTIFLANIKEMAEAGATLTSRIDEETGKVIFGWDFGSAQIGSGYKGSYGGSGGSKKSNADKLVERLGHGQSLYEHQIKMVQYEQTKYENADELGNYGKMLEEELKIERAYLPVLESNIAALRSELSNVKKGSEDWYKLRDAILEAEEQYADINNTIDENEKKLEENHQAILKLHTDLEDIVVGEIELRIDAEKEMLDGSVSMQNIVLEAVKQRYRDEWDLIKQDIEKKKEALQQEKDLIDERLDARREAEDEAAKYEELAELKKQLSFISTDSTRTKDAAVLRESIAELEKEIGWDIAEKQAENEKNAIQDQMDAYDDYINKGDEDLDELLSDANNFTEEVNSVMKLNHTELFDWLKQNVKEYTNSLDDAQKQMVQSWEATYKQMLGITDTYWDEVNSILSSKDSFLEYMKQSNEYIYASEDERKQLLYQWEESYDKWMKAKKEDANYSHGDSGLGDWSGSEYTGGSSGGSGGSSGSSGTTTKDPDVDDTVVNSAPSNRGPFFVSNVSSGKVGSSYTSLNSAMMAAKELAEWRGENVYVKDANGNLIYTYNSSGMATLAPGAGMSNAGSSNGLPESGWPETPPNHKPGYWYYKITENGKNVSISDGYPTRALAQEAAARAVKNGQKYSTKQYAKGGVADFTGLAWLDGSPSEPERILSADQTRDFETLVSIMSDFRNAGVPMDALRSMARWSTMISVPSSLSHIGGAAYQGNSANIGDIFINITEAQISDDRDIEVLANIVGEKFVKEIGKQGFNVSRYNL